MLAFAGERDAICLACDLPFISAELLAKLAGAGEPQSGARGSPADVVAPRAAAPGKWQPLFARYRSLAVAPWLERALAEGERSFQGLFARLRVRELLLDERERAQLRDWDSLEDMHADQ